MIGEERFFTKGRLAFLGVLLLSVLVYLPCMGGLPMWDDKAILTGWGIGGGKSWEQCFTNPFLLHYYRPFTSLSYYLDITLFGAKPIFLHQTNLILHAAATAMVMLLTRALLGRPRVALLAGLLFAIQPAQVGTIAWIGGRCDQLGALLVLAMAYGVVRYHQTNRLGWLVLGVATFFSAMMVKEQFALFGALVPLAAVALRPKEERTRVAVWSAAPFVIVGAIFVGLWLAHYPEPYDATKFGAGEQVSRLGRTSLNYALLFLFPNPWSMHTFSLESLRSPVLIWLGLTIFASLFVGLRALWRHERRLAWLATGIVVGFLPVSNLVPLPSLLAAPYRVGVVGPMVAILMAVGLAGLARKRRYVGLALLGVGAFSGLVLTPWGAGKWTSESTFFGTAVAYDPGTLVLRTCLTNALDGEKRTGEALAQTEAVLDHLFPAGAWRDYGHIASLTKQEDIRWRLLSSDGFGRKPDEEVSLLLAMRGHLLRAAHRDGEAVQALKAAAQVNPADGKAWLELGHLAKEAGTAWAATYYRRALACNPKDSVAASLLANELRRQGKAEKAYAVLRRIPSMKPDFGEPLLDLAEMQIQRGARQDAVATLDQARHTIVDVTRLSELRGRAQQGRS